MKALHLIHIVQSILFVRFLDNTLQKLRIMVGAIKQLVCE